ncbi:MAG: SIS domain-containing protein [Candidatus Hodarchaeota archaeon]
MKKHLLNDISSFYSAYDSLITQGKKVVNSINENPSSLVEFCKYLEEVRDAGNRLHVVGMGRSGKVGMLIGELLKNIGIKVSYLGKSLARPVRENDVVFGVTGSGWTNFTANALQDSLKKGANVIAFTGNSRSIAGRLADSIIEIPQGYSKTSREQLGRAPLTPMGTMFELSSLLVGIGVVSGINDGSIVKGFNEGINEVLSAAEETLSKIKKNEVPIKQFIRNVESFSAKSGKNVYLFGSGLDSIVASMASIRFNHLKIDIKSSYDWRFRRENDLLIAISGSGVSTRTLERVMSAKSVPMKVISFTSFPKSELAQNSELFIEIEGRTEKTNAYLQQISKLKYFIPSFEYVTSITLDACVAQLALDLGISESEMEAEHANIE